MRYAMLLVCVGLVRAGLAHGATTAGAEPVVVRRTSLEIPTYALGPVEKNPPYADPYGPPAAGDDAPLYNPNVYPYPMQTDVTRRKGTRAYRAVILENAYLRLVILPDLGGRLYAAHDKTNDDFDFIYHNHVIKPALVALRGAWISGGIEWNYPTRGHTVNTFSPVQYKVVRGEDGSATCVVGTVEWVRRMKWAVFITLSPDRASFSDRIVLFNRTLTPNRAYYWSNAAVHAWPDTRVVFPPTDHTFAGMRRNPQPWPIKQGKDVSWYRNTPSAYDFFCGTPGDYHGAYNVERDCGTVHTAPANESLGQKFWTWGTARSGAIWEDLLTDADGQYIEIQAGRLPTQGDTWIAEPHLQESWEETWYPVKRMKGFVKANPRAAVNLAPQGDKLLAALNTTRPYQDATIEVVADGKPLWHDKLTVGPRAPWQREIPLAEKAKVYGIVFSDREGRQIIAYHTGHKPVPPPDLEPEFPPVANASTEEIYLQGYYALKHWNRARAVELFRQALKRDPGFTPALRGLALFEYRRGRYEASRKLCQKALRRNDDDATARYYGALCKLKLGINQPAEQDLWRIGRRAAYRHLAPYLLASLAVEQGDWDRAQTDLRRAIRHNPGDLKAGTMLAAVLRHGGRPGEALKHVERVLAEDPINALAVVERVLQGGRDELDLLRDDPQYYLEVACDYAELNLRHDAVSALELYQRRGGARKHPFVDFYLGYLADAMGRHERARQCYRQGVELSPQGVFPFRGESLAVLETGLRYQPEHWKLHYYLGTLLVAKTRWREGLDQFLAAAKSDPSCSVLYTNLGQLYWHKVGDPEKARDAYEKALALDPGDCHNYLALNRLYDETGEQQERRELFQRAPPAVRENFRVLFARAVCHHDQGRDDEALAILRGHTFLPWEGQTDAHQLYARILHRIADRRMRQGDYEEAMDVLRQAMQYPENLGSGKPHDPDYRKEYCKLGLCCKALGRIGPARQYFGKAAQPRGNDAEGRSPWQQRALEELKTLGEGGKEP